MSAKLTKAQGLLLIGLSEAPQVISKSYRPAQALVEAGYAEWIERRLSVRLALTDNGRAVLAREGVDR